MKQNCFDPLEFTREELNRCLPHIDGMKKAILELDQSSGGYLIHISAVERIAKKYKFDQILLWRAFLKYANEKYVGDVECSQCPTCGR